MPFDQLSPIEPTGPQLAGTSEHLGAALGDVNRLAREIDGTLMTLDQLLQQFRDSPFYKDAVRFRGSVIG